MYFIKKANLREDLKNDWSNLKYLLKHKKEVYDAGVQIGAPRWQLMKHDLSKFTPQEWVPYRQRFNAKLTPEVRKTFRDAVANHHYPRNLHHVKAWPGGVQEMPFKYKIEAVADWYGSAKAQGKTELDFSDWFLKARAENKLAGMDNATLDVIEHRILTEEGKQLDSCVASYLDTEI